MARKCIKGRQWAWGPGTGRIYLVKISFVTAAMLYLSRRARHSFSIKAVLPDPTGLRNNVLVVTRSNAHRLSDWRIEIVEYGFGTGFRNHFHD